MVKLNQVFQKIPIVTINLQQQSQRFCKQFSPIKRPRRKTWVHVCSNQCRSDPQTQQRQQQQYLSSRSSIHRQPTPQRPKPHICSRSISITVITGVVHCRLSSGRVGCCSNNKLNSSLRNMTESGFYRRSMATLLPPRGCRKCVGEQPQPVTATLLHDITP